MLSPIAFFGVLSILVLVHEFGHFMAARLLKIRVEEFALGLPFTRPIVSFKRGETQYAIYPLLFGGFVRLFGEEDKPEAKKGEKGRDYWSRHWGQRIAVVLAGVVMNVVLAVGAFFLLYGVVGVPKQTSTLVTVRAVEKDSPALAAGFLADDRIVKVENKNVASVQEFKDLMGSWGGVGVNVTVERGKVTPLFEGFLANERKSYVLNVVPRVKPPPGQGAIGVAIDEFPYLQTEKCLLINPGCLVGAFRHGAASTWMWGGRVIDGFRQIGKSLLAGKSPEGVSGPVGIYQLTGMLASYGWLPLVELIAVLSINLAIFNVLPIPALDGGRALFIILEVIRGKRISAKVEGRINSWGMTALLILLALITLQDVIRTGILDRFKLQ